MNDTCCKSLPYYAAATAHRLYLSGYVAIRTEVHTPKLNKRNDMLARQHLPSTWSYGESLSTMSVSEPLKSRTLSSKAMLLRAFSICPGARNLCLILSKVSSAASHFGKAPVIYNRSTEFNDESFFPQHVLQSFLKAQVVCSTKVSMVFTLGQQSRRK